MGHRDVRRVPLDFDWPLGEVWAGYLLPDSLSEERCGACGGSGYSTHASWLRNRWYGYVPFDPAETGSTPLTPDTPEVRAFAERNVSRAPDYYGTSEEAVVQEATRLADMWNGQWNHHLDQDDVDALHAAGRLRGVPDAADLVNRWSIEGFGHDAINCHVVIEARCAREGVPYTCDACGGAGSMERYPGQRAQAEAWEPTDPPAGDGWQLWETTTEGSPKSPVFKTPEELAAWCADHATVFADMRATYGEWLRMIVGDTLDVGSLAISVGGGPLTFAQRAGEMSEYDPDA